LLSLKEMAIALLVFSAAALFCLFAYRALRSSHAVALSKVPNAHPLAPYTSLWIAWKRWTNREIHVVQAAYARNGPIVRLGPSEVALNDMPNGILVAHGSPGFDKSTWYDFYINYG